jgi:predicted acetyltransferase
VRGTLPAGDGTFNDRGLRPFLANEPGRAAYLFRRDDNPAGFALVQLVEPLMLAEFFVARGARGQGIGRAAALAILERHPGTWEIAFQENNVAAARFWRRLCADVAVDGVREELRAVPGKPDVPPDVWLTMTVARGSEPQTLSS